MPPFDKSYTTSYPSAIVRVFPKSSSPNTFWNIFTLVNFLRQNHASLLRWAPNTSTWDFPDVIKFHVAVHTTQNHASLLRRAPSTDSPDVIKFRVAVHTLWEKAIRFRHPGYDPDRAQKFTRLSMSRHGQSGKHPHFKYATFHQNPSTRF